MAIRRLRRGATPAPASMRRSGVPRHWLLLVLALLLCLGMASLAAGAGLSSTVDLIVDKSLEGDPPLPGGSYSYWIWYENLGDEPALDVRITETLPAGVTLIDASPAVVYLEGNVAAWDAGTVYGGFDGYIHIELQVGAGVPPGTILTNTVSIGSSSSDDVPSNNIYSHAVVVAAPPTPVVDADFVGAPLSGQPTRVSGHPPLVVTFTNQSTGATSYLWSFGDGVTSTATAPTHTYTAAGSYTVTLTANGAGGSDSLTRADYVQAYTFADVPPTHPSWLAIEAVKRAGVTAGCNPQGTLFCPDGVVKREEIAVFIDRALGWPPTPGVFPFGDMPDYWATPFAVTLWQHGVTAGCQAQGQPLRYCPLYVLSKAEIATMIRAASGWAPVNPPVGIFADVPVSHWAAPHVEAFYAHTPGSQCSAPGQPLLFCPNSQVSRAYMAELLASAFGL